MSSVELQCNKAAGWLAASSPPDRRDASSDWESEPPPLERLDSRHRLCSPRAAVTAAHGVGSSSPVASDVGVVDGAAAAAAGNGQRSEGRGEGLDRCPGLAPPLSAAPSRHIAISSAAWKEKHEEANVIGCECAAADSVATGVRKQSREMARTRTNCAAASRTPATSPIQPELNHELAETISCLHDIFRSCHYMGGRTAAVRV